MKWTRAFACVSPRSLLWVRKTRRQIKKSNKSKRGVRTGRSDNWGWSHLRHIPSCEQSSLPPTPTPLGPSPSPALNLFSRRRPIHLLSHSQSFIFLRTPNKKETILYARKEGSWKCSLIFVKEWNYLGSNLIVCYDASYTVYTVGLDMLSNNCTHADFYIWFYINPSVLTNAAQKCIHRVSLQRKTRQM